MSVIRRCLIRNSQFAIRNSQFLFARRNLKIQFLNLTSIRNSQSEIRDSNPQPAIRNFLPIGIFDSGVGGLTVYRALHERLPNERFVYLGDTARVPYGTKSLTTVERYAIENSKFLEAHGIKLLVVACNTASALALPAIRNAVGVEVVGVIEPGARAAVQSASGKTIGIIATEATVHSRAYARAIGAIDPKVTVIERACPLFVSLAEEGWVETEVTRGVAAEYLGELAGEGLGALVMGCTHYPILRNVIGETIGTDVPLIDSGEATAREVEILLNLKGLSSSPRESLADERKLCDDLDHFYVTDAAERFAKVAERFLGSAPSVLEAVEVWGHDELRTH
ncbi:MAG: Glutamate racemase [Acidobacteria bacterium]|nr:Glutamate racemase [Acidobacteriota bacterium]